MRCGWGPYFRRTFEVQAGNSPLQGQSKPPAKLVVLIYGEKKKACKSEKQALARLFYFRKGCEHSGKKKDKETPV